MRREKKGGDQYDQNVIVVRSRKLVKMSGLFIAVCLFLLTFHVGYEENVFFWFFQSHNISWALELSVSLNVLASVITCVF